MISLLFRMPGIVYLLLAPIALGLGIWGYFSAEHDDAARKQALSHGPPAAVAIERYSAGQNRGDYDEVVIEGQLDVDKIVDVKQTKGSRTIGEETVAPLYATDARDRARGIAAVFISDVRLSDETIKAMIVRQGSFGPIIRIDGIDTTENGVPEAVTTAGDKIGTIPEKTVFLNPFDADRKQELAPRHESFGVLIFGAVAALMLAIYGFIRLGGSAGREDEASA